MCHYKNKHFGPFQDHPQYSKRSNLRKAIKTCESLPQKKQAHSNKYIYFFRMQLQIAPGADSTAVNAPIDLTW